MRVGKPVRGARVTGDEAKFRARIEAAQSDAKALADLASELQALDAAWVRPVQYRLVAARLKLRAPLAAVPTLVTEMPPKWSARFGLPFPDGRPIYRYRMGHAAFVALGDHLRTRAAVMRSQVIEADAALFVVWSAEWFRRVYAGGGEEWASLGVGIGLTCEQAQWRALADRGLKYWQIPALRLSNTHHRLVALARQGGFPLAALGNNGSDAKGWAAQYLGRLVGHLLSEPVLDEANALAHAQALTGIIPRTWANPGMIQVCAELAVGIVRLRRDAEAAGVGDGALAIAWLDAQRPEWRAALPVALDDATAQRLLSDLMRTRAIRGGGAAITARRVLSFVGNARREQLELLLEGTLASDDPRQLLALSQEWSRLRLYPAGVLAQHIGGELGVAVSGDNGTWTVRPSAIRAAFDVPFSVAAEVELRGDGKRVAGPFTMPQGGAINGGLLVLREDGDRFVVEGSGSGSYRADVVHLDTPDDWRIEMAGSASATTVHEHMGRRLTRVAGDAHVHTRVGDIYLIRTGQAADQRDRMIVVGSTPASCRAMDNLSLVCGAPQLFVGSDASFRAAGGEGWWRPAGDRQWRPVTRHMTAGPTDFAWRDPATGCIRARASAFVLPAEFTVSRRISGDSIELSVSGWSGTVACSIGIDIGGNRWRVPTVPRSMTPAVLNLGLTQGQPAQIAVVLPQRAWIHEWHQGPAARNSVISLAMLHRYVARSDGHCDLVADLMDRDGRLLNQGRATWIIEGELALAAIRDDIAALLRPLGDIRARVRLDFNDGHNNYWYVSEFENELRSEVGGYVPTSAIADDAVRIIGRSLSDPAAAPRDFGAYSLITHRPIELPQLQGDWLVYLRSDDRVLSCPHLHRGEPLSETSASPLGQAMAVSNRVGRLKALNTLCDQILTSPQEMRGTLRDILDLILSLDGLPPATFDILGLLPERPEVAALILFVARQSEVEAVMRLSDGLPFAWSLIPRAAWDRAACVQAEAMFAALPDAVAIVGEEIGTRRQQIATLDPALRPLLNLSCDVLPLRKAANDFLNRSHDQIKQVAHSPFRPEHEAALPAWAMSASFWRALDAPAAAALSVQGRITLNPALVRCIKDVARAHPVWFEQGFAAALHKG